jgi:3'(2'), 5'-bisphosphate nucleotidase
MSDPELDQVIRIARSAAIRVRAVYATDFSVELKGPGDPVTLADREANEIICAALTAAFPGDAILAEESVPGSRSEIERRASSPRVWFVDPLDGTREFANKNGEFAVMIGLAISGRAALGVLVLPVTGEVLAGRIGHPGAPQSYASPSAFLETPDGLRRTLVVSAVADPRRAVLVASRSHRPAILEPFIKELGVAEVMPCGSVGVKIARIVLGQADLYVHAGLGAKHWDTCAPEAVLVAAGGRFSDLNGAPIDYASPDLVLRHGICATNGELHDAALAAVARIGNVPEPSEGTGGPPPIVKG